MEHKPRIPLNPQECKNYMVRTDENQKSVLTPPSTQRYTLYGWTEEESTTWSAFRKGIEELYALYSDPDKTGPAIRKLMKLLIKKIRAYDNDKIDGHFLLNKVAIYGTLDDWLTFNVKRDTTLASKPTHHNNSPEQIVPEIHLLENTFGSHLLHVSNPETPTTKKLPEGVVFAKIFRSISTEQPASLKAYEFIGNAFRGKYISSLEDIERDEHTRLFAYYYCRYESKKGKLGPPSKILRVEILLLNL
jgi:hypothetical protein